MLLWGHRRWRRCVELCSHLRTQCVMCVRLCCRCILLRAHRLGSRWITLMSHRLSSRCIKLCLVWWGKEIRRHTIPNSRIPSIWESRCKSTLHSCRNTWSSHIHMSCCSCRRCGSSLWWCLTITCLCPAVLSRQSCRHGHFQGYILHLIWLYVTRTHATWKRAFCKSLDYCVVHYVAHDCCALDKCLCHGLRQCVDAH